MSEKQNIGIITSWSLQNFVVCVKVRHVYSSFKIITIISHTQFPRDYHYTTKLSCIVHELLSAVCNIHFRLVLMKMLYSFLINCGIGILYSKNKIFITLRLELVNHNMYEIINNVKSLCITQNYFISFWIYCKFAKS